MPAAKESSMHPIRHTLLCAGLCSLVACGEDAPSGGSTSRLSAGEAEFPVDVAIDGGTPADAGSVVGDSAVLLPDSGTVTDLSCPRGGNTAPIRVIFACNQITVITCKDLSNVVIELDDGSRQRTQGLKGHQNGFVAPTGRSIVGVWVKAGANSSGDGPGYGQRFDAPTGICTDGGTTTPDGGTATGDSGTGTPPPTNPPPQDPPPPQNPPPQDPPPPDGPGLVD
jgi:hypothetical protein